MVEKQAIIIREKTRADGAVVFVCVLTLLLLACGVANMTTSNPSIQGMGIGLFALAFIINICLMFGLILKTSEKVKVEEKVKIDIKDRR